MSILYIKTADFIGWYFNSGSDQEQREMKYDLGKAISEKLHEGKVVVTAQELLDGCEQSIIPMNIVEKRDGQTYEELDGELGMYFQYYEVKLKN